MISGFDLVADADCKDVLRLCDLILSEPGVLTEDLVEGMILGEAEWLLDLERLTPFVTRPFEVGCSRIREEVGDRGAAGGGMGPSEPSLRVDVSLCLEDLRAEVGGG